MTTPNKTEGIEAPWEGELLDKVIHIRLDSDLYSKLLRKCKRKGTKVSMITRHLLQNWLEPGSVEL